MGFLDRQPFDGTDPDGRALLAALRAVYDQAPAVRGLDDDQVRVLRSCAAALKDFMTAADTAERISRFSPEFADISATMQFELSRAKRELLALKQSVGLTNWPDAGLAAKLITARNR